jgi:hypothetical protein
MFGWLQKNRKNRIDELANRLAREGKADQIERELERFDPKELKGPERESWFHLWGITAFRRGDRSTAFARFRAAREACPTSSVIAFSLGQEHEARGEPALMFELFDACRFPKVPASHALVQARYAYLWDDLSRAESYIEPIFEAYWSLGIVDDTFLYIRGLPFFTQTWAYLAAFLELGGSARRARSENKTGSKSTLRSRLLSRTGSGPRRQAPRLFRIHSGATCGRRLLKDEGCSARDAWHPVS